MTDMNRDPLTSDDLRVPIEHHFDSINRDGRLLDVNSAELSKAALDVLAERRRQIEIEGWTPEHDDEHTNGAMAFAAAAYAVHAHAGPRMSKSMWLWTGWARKWFKPKDERADLVRAGALVIAEIERLDRAAAKVDESADLHQKQVDESADLHKQQEQGRP